MCPQVLTFSMYVGFGSSIAATAFMLLFHPPVWVAFIGYVVAVIVTGVFGFVLRNVR